MAAGKLTWANAFQSAPSLRRATMLSVLRSASLDVSIRALPAEGDQTMLTTCFQLWEFQSAPSLRRATISTSAGAGHSVFQSAPSLRRATGSTRRWI